MTLLVAWVGVDTHGVSSTYIASDSRISWQGGATFDYGRKVFAFANHPDVLGYSGDVLFPSLALNQIVQLADAGMLFGPDFTSVEKFQKIVEKLNHLGTKYPADQAGLTENRLSIIHASRGGQSGQEFFCQTIVWSRDGGWIARPVQLPAQSEVLFAKGSGEQEFRKNYERYRSSSNSGTSRAVFHCFCDTLANTEVASVGGAPQLVGLYRKPGSPGQNFGVVWSKKRYFLGAHIDDLRVRASNVQWRNDNFEIVNGITMSRLDNAQQQPDPLRRL